MAETKAPNTIAEQLITDHLDIWTTAIEQKSSSGRGSSKKFSLHGIKKLRELILELAVRGKLVPQDPNDEPASVLLERIAAEKAQLFKYKKIKKPKVLPEISEDEKPFELPRGWGFSRLGFIGEIFNGNSVNAKLKETKYTGLTDGLPFIATKDVNYGFSALDYDNGVLIPLEEPKFKVAKKGSVLICAEGGSAGKKCGLVSQNVCFGNKLFALNLYGDIDPKFILSNYQTPAFYAQFSNAMTGIIGGISLAKFGELLIPVPPLKEQQRIVAKVDELMGLCDALEAQTENSITAHQTLVEVLLEALLKTPEQTATPEQATAQFQQNWQRLSEQFDTLFTTTASIDTLKQTILQLAVMGKLVPQNPNDEHAAKLLERIAAEKAQLIKDKKIKKQKPLPEITDEEKPFELPKGWEWCRIFDASLFTEYGTSEKAMDGADGIPVLKMGDIQGGKVFHGGQKVVPSTINDLPNLYLKYGDVLYNRTNSAELVGKTGMFEGEDDTFTFASYLIRIRCQLESVTPHYLTLTMNTPFFRKTQIDPHVKQQCGQANVNGTIMKSMLVPICPIEEQHRIVAKVDELMTLCDQLKARLTDAQNTKLHLTDAIVDQAVN